MKNTIIICNANSSSETLDFFSECGGERHYIFTRKYRKSLYNYFRNGVSIYKLFDYSKTHGNEIIIHTISQLKSALRYLEKEYGVQVLGNKQNSKRSYRRRKECRLDLAA